MIDIAIAYVALDGKQYYEELSVLDGTTIYQAIERSGWFELPELADFKVWCANNHTQNPNHRAWYVGIYSQKQKLDAIVQQGDRIEIYRSLSHDPMSRRKNRSKSLMKCKSPKM